MGFTRMKWKVNFRILFIVSSFIFYAYTVIHTSNLFISLFMQLSLSNLEKSGGLELQGTRRLEIASLLPSFKNNK